jgi:hypothetical protein
VVKKTPEHAPRPGGMTNLRVILDYCRLNAKSSQDRYSIRGVEECSQEVGFAQSKLFMTLDLMASFWQIMLAKSACPYTVLTVPGEGQFQWCTSLMGLMGCPTFFSRLMDTAMRGLQNILMYINNILFHSNTVDNHLQHMEVALKCLKLNLLKCTFTTQ